VLPHARIHAGRYRDEVRGCISGERMITQPRRAPPEGGKCENHGGGKADPEAARCAHKKVVCCLTPKLSCKRTNKMRRRRRRYRNAIVSCSATLASYVSELRADPTTLRTRATTDVQLITDDEGAHRDQHAEETPLLELPSLP
jgi:hypothetical protein